MLRMSVQWRAADKQAVISNAALKTDDNGEVAINPNKFDRALEGGEIDDSGSYKSSSTA